MSGLTGIKTIDQLDLRDKRVFIRCDFNVPLKKGEITDDTRIRGALPTIEYALKAGAKVILASHLGRPKGDPSDKEKFSLLPVAERLQDLLKIEVLLLDDPMAEGAKGLVPALGPKKVLLLENTRFQSGEEANSVDLAAHWASFTDIYVDDAFGAIHRAHASVSALPSLVKTKACGFLIKKEVEMLDKLLSDVQHPFTAILGGAKVSDKIGVIDNLMDQVDTFIIGGAMAYTFLAAQKIEVGKSLVENDKLTLAKELMERLRLRRKTLLLPVDHVVAEKLQAGVSASTTNREAITPDKMGLDIGPKTIELFSNEIKKAKTIFWNGPMGAFETSPFEKGTFEIAKVLSGLNSIRIVGGGDSVTAVEKAGATEKMTHISTGGGASLEYLEGMKLPGLEVLRQ